MKTQIFEYKGFLGIADGDIFINDPLAPGQLGAVISVDEIEITQSAYDLIDKAPREGGSFAEIMVTKHNDPTRHGVGSLGHMNFGQLIFNPGFKKSRDCTVDVLKSCITDTIVIPKEFINVIDEK